MLQVIARNQPIGTGWLTQAGCQFWGAQGRHCHHQHVAVDGLLLYENARRTLEAVIWQSAQTQPRTLLVVDPFDVLLPWATPALKPLLARGHMRFIGAAILEDYRAKAEPDAAN